MAEFHLRPVDLYDSAALAHLMGVLGYPTSAEQMRARLTAIIADPNYHTVVAEVDGQVRGMVGLRRGHLYELDGPYVQLVAIVVDSDYQGRGIGAGPVHYAETWARNQGAARISLTSGKQRHLAHRFYERLGYEATGLRFVKVLQSHD